MTPIDCPLEQELLDALVSSRWPDRCDPALRAHVDGCPSCTDTLAVALPLIREGDAAFASARVPSSGIVWWRAQMRARREAERAANRPIVVAQGVALACVLAFAVGAALWLRPERAAWDGWLASPAAVVGQFAAGLETAGSSSGMLPWIVLAVWLVLAPVAIYFAVTED